MANKTKPAHPQRGRSDKYRIHLHNHSMSSRNKRSREDVDQNISLSFHHQWIEGKVSRRSEIMKYGRVALTSGVNPEAHLERHSKRPQSGTRDAMKPSAVIFNGDSTLMKTANGR